jgi:hypothetical protein
MIDTDKYEGHTPGPWRIDKIMGIVTAATDERQGDMPVTALTNQRFQTMTLMADAPLLLDFIVWVKNTHPHYYHKLTKAYEGAKNNR